MALRVHVRVPSDQLANTEDLLRRARQVFDLMRSGQEDLSLLDGRAVEESKILIVDGGLVLLPVIPRAIQQDAFMPTRRRARRIAPGVVARCDEAEQQAIEQIVAALRRSAALVDQVGIEMSTTANLRERLHRLESEQKVDTEPARRFHYRKQAAFFVEIEGERIDFKHQAVRQSVATTGCVQVQATLVANRSRVTSFRARIDACGETGRNEGIASGGEHEFQLRDLAWWQRSCLDIGASLGLAVDMSVIERMSTACLRAQPAEVQELRGWLRLLSSASVALNAKAIEIERLVNDEVERLGASLADEAAPMVDAA